MTSKITPKASCPLSYAAQLEETYNKAVAKAREVRDAVYIAAQEAYDTAIEPAERAKEDAIIAAHIAYSKAVAPARAAFADTMRPADIILRAAELQAKCDRDEFYRIIAKMQELTTTNALVDDTESTETTNVKE